jgi:hypothetical protein
MIAICHMGTHQPFVVWWQQEPGCGDAAREVLGGNADSVLEFET